MTNKNIEPKVREAIGVYGDVEQLRAAIRDLVATGLDTEKMGLLASENVVKQSLGEFYFKANEKHGSEGAPAIAFVSEDALPEAGQSMGGGLFFVGTAGVAGAVVSSAAVLGGAVLTAIGGVVGVGLVALGVGAVIHQSDANFLQHQIDEGRLLLFVRVNPDNEQKVKEILKSHFAIDIKVLDVPVKNAERARAQPV